MHFVVTAFLALALGLGITVMGYFPKGAVPASALWGVTVAIPWVPFFWLWRRGAYLDLKPGFAVRGSAVYALAVLILVAALRRLGWLSPFTAFLLQAVAGFAASALLIVYVRPQLSSGFEPAMRVVLKQHWEYGRWVVVTAFVYWLSGGAYYVIVGALLRMEDVAALRALQNFVLPVPQFLTAMGLLLVPWASRSFADHDNLTFRWNIQRMSLLLTTAAVAYLVVLVLFGRWLVDVFYRSRYTQFASLLPLLALPVLLTAASEGPAIAVQAMQAPSEISLGYAVAGAVGIVVGVAFTRYWGLVGAALGMSTSSLAFLIVIIYRYQARLKKVPVLASPSQV